MLTAVQYWLTRDYLPRLQPYLRWMKHPLAWLVLAILATLLFGAAVQPRVYWLSTGIGGLTVLGLFWPWLAMRGVSCQVTFQHQRTTEGEPTTILLTLTNRWPWPLWGLSVIGGFQRASSIDCDEQSTVETALAMVPAWSESVFRWDYQPLRRGIYPKSDTYIATGFPFGLWQARRLAVVEERLIVWPRRHAIPATMPNLGCDLNGTGLADTRPGDVGDYLGVRPYRHGDALRQVHWRQTAKHNRLIVCERQSTTRPGVRVVADLRATPNALPHDAALEQVIRTAASLCESLHQRFARVEYCDSDTTIHLERHGLEPLLDHLAVVPDGGFVGNTTPTNSQPHAVQPHRGMLEVMVARKEHTLSLPHFASVATNRSRVVIAEDPPSVQNQWEAICREG